MPFESDFLLPAEVVQNDAVQASEYVCPTGGDGMLDLASVNRGVRVTVYQDDPDFKIEFESDYVYGMSFGLSWRNSSFSWLEATGVSSSLEPDPPGQTDHSGFSYSWYGPRHWLQFFYFDYSGLNYDFPGEEGFRSDARSTGFGASWYFVSNGRQCSMQAAYQNRGRQMRPAWSLVSLLSVTSHTLRGDGPLVDAVAVPELAGLSGLSKVSGSTIAAAGGCELMLAAKGAYATIGIIVGPALAYYNYDGVPDTNTGFQLDAKTATHMAAGYTGNNWYLGMGFTTDGSSLESGDSRLHFTYTETFIRFGVIF